MDTNNTSSVAGQQLAAVGTAIAEGLARFTAWLAAHPELRGFSIGAKGHEVWAAAEEATAPSAPTDSRPEGFAYSIDPRDEQLGGGWRLKLLENGEEVGGGVFPVTPGATTDDAYVEACEEGEAWLQSRLSTDDPIAPTETQATLDMLDMLGRLHPYEQPYHGEEFKRRAYERLRRVMDLQQPAPVPDQAAVVWRGDLIAMWCDLTHKQAVFDDWSRSRADLPHAARDVLAERRRQVEKEGYSTNHDDEHPSGEIAAYAAFYAMPPAVRDWPAEETGYGATWGEAIIPAHWGPAKPGDRRRELVKAGALILAEIERIDRAAMQRAPSAEKGCA
jgi:hypothetical protein